MSSPDIDWSYSGFSTFRTWLSQAEGFALSDMCGFGGERPWSSVSTTLEPLLDHPDDAGPDLTPAQCAAMLPRLEAIINQQDDSDPIARKHAGEVRRLIVVMKLCLEKDVALLFG